MNNRFLVAAGSILSLALLPQLAVAQTAAFNAITGTIGNTSGTAASYGSNFDVVSGITIFSLGAFDSSKNGGTDGFAAPVTVYIYDRNTQLSVASLLFTNASPGTVLTGSEFRTKPLPTALRLNAGGLYSVVADFNAFDPVGINMAAYTTNSGGGLISFTARPSQFGTTPATYPTSSVTDTYLAGTFTFQSTTPEPGVVGLLIGLGTAGLGAGFRSRKRRS